MTEAADVVTRLASDLGGTIEQAGSLPDGSGFALMSFPLPADHWSVVDPAGFNVPPMPLRMGTDHPQYDAVVAALRAAVRYGYRAATMNGKYPDLDPDALSNNIVVGLVGYHTPDGLSSEDWANPSPVPEIVQVTLGITTRVVQVIVKELGVDVEKCTAHADLMEDLGADSLDVIEIVIEIEKAFDLDVPDEDVDKCKTVGDWIAYLVQRGVA